MITRRGNDGKDHVGLKNKPTIKVIWCYQPWWAIDVEYRKRKKHKEKNDRKKDNKLNSIKFDL